MASGGTEPEAPPSVRSSSPTVPAGDLLHSQYGEWLVKMESAATSAVQSADDFLELMYHCDDKVKMLELRQDFKNLAMDTQLDVNEAAQALRDVASKMERARKTAISRLKAEKYRVDEDVKAGIQTVVDKHTAAVTRELERKHDKEVREGLAHARGNVKGEVEALEKALEEEGAAREAAEKRLAAAEARIESLKELRSEMGHGEKLVAKVAGGGREEGEDLDDDDDLDEMGSPARALSLEVVRLKEKVDDVTAAGMEAAREAMERGRAEAMQQAEKMVEDAVLEQARKMEVTVRNRVKIETFGLKQANQKALIAEVAAREAAETEMQRAAHRLGKAEIVATCLWHTILRAGSDKAQLTSAARTTLEKGRVLGDAISLLKGSSVNELMGVAEEKGEPRAKSGREGAAVATGDGAARQDEGEAREAGESEPVHGIINGTNQAGWLAPLTSPGSSLGPEGFKSTLGIRRSLSLNSPKEWGGSNGWQQAKPVLSRTMSSSSQQALQLQSTPSPPTSSASPGGSLESTGPTPRGGASRSLDMPRGDFGGGAEAAKTSRRYIDVRSWDVEPHAPISPPPSGAATARRGASEYGMRMSSSSNLLLMAAPSDPGADTERRSYPAFEIGSLAPAAAAAPQRRRNSMGSRTAMPPVGQAVGQPKVPRSSEHSVQLRVSPPDFSGAVGPWGDGSPSPPSPAPSAGGRGTNSRRSHHLSNEARVFFPRNGK